LACVGGFDWQCHLDPDHGDNDGCSDDRADACDAEAAPGGLVADSPE